MFDGNPPILCHYLCGLASPLSPQKPSSTGRSPHKRGANISAILNNGETQGGDPKTFQSFHGVPGLEHLWQLHRSAHKGANQADDQFIANLDERTAYRLKLTASEDGSFTVTNVRTGFTKHYDPK